MAFEPSKSKNKGKGKGLPAPSEPDMLPIMNLMVVLIPVLLSAAEMVKVRTLTVNLPVSAVVNGGSGNNEQPSELPKEVKNLELTITVTKEGFFIASKGFLLGDLITLNDPAIASQISDINAVLSEKSNGKNGGEKARFIIAKYADGFKEEDYKKVTKALVALKEIIEIKKLEFSDFDKIILAAENEINYQTIVSTIDAVRYYVDSKGFDDDLFPVVEFGGF